MIPGVCRGNFLCVKKCGHRVRTKPEGENAVIEFTPTNLPATTRKRYAVFYDHGTPWKVHILRRFGFVCIGPYHTGRWSVFYGNTLIKKGGKK